MHLDLSNPPRKAVAIIQNILQDSDWNTSVEIVVNVSRERSCSQRSGYELGVIAINGLVERSELSQLLRSDESINVFDSALQVLYTRRSVRALQFDGQLPVRTAVVSQFELVLADILQS